MSDTTAVTAYRGPERRMNDERITRLEGRVDGHEVLCAERYKNLENAILSNRNSTERIYKMIWAALITILIGLAGNFFATMQRDHHEIKSVRSSITEDK